MKSAYELAMERLQKDSPTLSITEEQKREIAEIDSLYRSRIAEKEIFLQGEIQKATAARQYDELESLRTQLSREVRRLQEECEEKKEKVRQRGAH